MQRYKTYYSFLYNVFVLTNRQKNAIKIAFYVMVNPDKTILWNCFCQPRGQISQ